VHKTILIGVIALLLIPIASAADYRVSYFLEYDVAYTEIKAKFDEPIDSAVYELPYDARGIRLFVGGDEINPELDGVELTIPMENSTWFKLEYMSKSMASNEFITTIQYPFDAKKTIVRLSLPADSTIARPLSSSVVPKPDDLFTDGSNIGIAWVFRRKAEGEEIPLLVKYENPGSIWPYVIIGSVLLFFVILSTALIMGKSAKKQLQKPQDAKASEVSGYAKHLKEDEEQLVEILKMKEGSCEQCTLRVVTGFSKAKLSGLLKEMEERKIIYKEKRGKKHLVFLKKQ
jgi:hypothetical protein